MQQLRAARPHIVVLVNSGWSSTDLESGPAHTNMLMRQ
jgi:hypothetical protein